MLKEECLGTTPGDRRVQPHTQVDVSKGPTPYLPSESVLVSHSQLHGLQSSLLTKKHTPAFDTKQLGLTPSIFVKRHYANAKIASEAMVNQHLKKSHFISLATSIDLLMTNMK